MKKLILIAICLIVVGCSSSETNEEEKNYQLSNPRLEQDSTGIYTIKAIYRNVSNEQCDPYAYVIVKSGSLTYQTILTAEKPIEPNQEAELFGYCHNCKNLDINSIEMSYGDVFCSQLK